MRIEGQGEEFYQVIFPHGLVPQILQLLVDTWAGFTRPTNEESEPKITNRFVLALQRKGRERRVRFRIMPHPKDVEHLDPVTGRGFAEIDICVPYGYEARCYFGIEAKKLNITRNGKWESQVGGYVGKEGMGCFIDGRYANYQCEGAMVGYVMDGDCPDAKSRISQFIDKSAADLRVPIPCPLNVSRALPSYPHAFETEHKLDRGEFTIHHVLLAA